MSYPTLELDLPGLINHPTHRGCSCPQRLSGRLAATAGVIRAHLKPQNECELLCLHYDPAVTDARQLEVLAGRFSVEVALECPDLAAPSAANRSAGKERSEPIPPLSYGERFKALSPLARPLLAGLLMLAGWLLEQTAAAGPAIVTAVYLAAYLTAGWEPAVNGLRAAARLRFDVDLLMVLAAVGAAALGEWLEGAFLLFLFSLGHALEHFAQDRARLAITRLSTLAPQSAIVRREGRESEIPVEQLIAGDLVVILPGQRIPADGRVETGRSSIDQSPVTGESVPVDKAPGDELFAGTLNGHAPLEMIVTRPASDSTLARIIEMVSAAEAQKSPLQRQTERIEHAFVPAALAVTGLLMTVPPLAGWLTWPESIHRGLTLLVASSPCALIISTPSAVLAAIAQAARHGVLIKGGAHLEALGRVSMLAFDKTGTLTAGRPEVTDVAPLNGYSVAELLSLAAAVEQRSEHPLARAVLQRASDLPSLPGKLEAVEQIGGLGMQARLNGQQIRLGSRRLFGGSLPPAVEQAAGQFESQGKTILLVETGGLFAGVIALADLPRPAARPVLSELASMGVQSVMLTGDHPAAAEYIAGQTGLGSYRAGLLPGEKVDGVRGLRNENGGAVVGMVGDGINDAPALAAADLGIAMGAAGSDVALETADVVLMADNLYRLPFAIGLGRRARQISLQNVVISLGVIAVLAPLAMLGLAGIGLAVALHEGSTVVVALNALRLLRYQDV